MCGHVRCIIGVPRCANLLWTDLGLALALWPTVPRWMGARVNAQLVSGDEKWLKIRGRWPYGPVVLDVPSELPVLAA